MYLQGYHITVVGKNNELHTLLKWDFGGDKPFTNRAWNRMIESLKAIDDSHYPLIISDLDEPQKKDVLLLTKLDFEAWLLETFH